MTPEPTILDENRRTILAVDGGGTRCRFVLCNGTDQTLVEAGPANAFSDFDGTVACLLDGTKRLAQQAGVSVETVTTCPAFIGLAGVINPQIAKRLEQALPFPNARYADDRLAALRGALGASDGLLAHAGTGSFLGAQINGRHKLAGGWGAALGDEASALWVGRKALSLTLQAVDGFLSLSPLTQTLLTRFGDPSGIVTFGSTATPAAIGELAPLVTEHALDDDPTALQIMQSAADFIGTGLQHMGWTPGMTICLTGGIGPHYADYLAKDQQANLIAPKGPPIDGAIALARLVKTQ